MTVQMTMEEYEKLKAAQDTLEAMRNEVKRINAEDRPIERMYSILVTLGIKNGNWRNYV